MPSQALRVRRSRLEWALLGSVLALVGLFLAWDRWDDRRRTLAAESSRIAGHARAVEENLARQLSGAHAALLSMRERAGVWSAEEMRSTGVRRMQALVDAMPGVRTMSILDADGRVLSSNREELIGREFGEREYFRHAKAAADAAVLYVSPPFRTVLDVWASNVTLVRPGPGGGFDGVVTATLDPEYFEVALHSALYAPDMWAGVAHEGGLLLTISPPNPQALGRSLVVPGSLFSRHIASGAAATVLLDDVQLTGERRLMAQHTLKPAGLPMDRGFVIGVTRDVDALLAPWSRQTALYAALYLLLVGGSTGALALLQRRERALVAAEAVRVAQRRADAEQLDQALRGADLALWDHDVPTGRGTVNERYAQLIGEPAAAFNADAQAWISRLHPEDRERVLAANADALAGRVPFLEIEYRLRHRAGHWVWVLDRGKVIERDAEGRPLRMVGTLLDVTARREADEALRKSEQSLAITLQSIGDAVVSTDRDGRVTRMNAAAEQLTGWPPAEAVGRPLGEVFRIVDGQTRQPLTDPVAVVLATGEVVGLANDTILIARDGGERQIADSAAPIRDADGGVQGVVLVFSDVSERYRAQAALRASEQQLRLLLDTLHAGVVVHGPDTAVLQANPWACRLLGLSREQMLGKAAIDPYWAFLEDDGSPMPLARYPVNQVLASGRALNDFVVGVRRPDRDEPLWALCDAAPVRGEDGALRQVVVTFVDISARRSAEQELRLLGAGVARLNDVVLITEADPVHEPGPRIVFVNDAFERLTGWRREEVLGRSPRLLHGPGTDTAELARIDRALAAGEPVRSEVLNCAKDGRAYWVEVDIVPIRDAAGRATHLVWVARDVTGRRQAEQRLRAAQAELAATLDAVPDLLFDVDLDGRYHGWHSRRGDLLVARPEDFLGRTVREMLPAEVAEVVMTALHEAHRDGRSSGAQYELALPVGRRWFELSIARKAEPAGDGAPPRFVVLARDVTERKQAEAERRALERQLREVQKMESLGTLAGGIAHDFNNILAAILGNVALARQDLGPGHPAADSLEQIQRAGLRARSLVQQILTFSRRQPQERRAQPLRPVVEETVALLRATLPAGVRLTSALADEPLVVSCDATQLQQVLMNLCTNAWHALPAAGGQIEIGLAPARLDAAAASRIDDLAPGPYAHLWVADNGSGMDAATRARIFDPFFTTKPVGQGTGLGLPVVHGIVAAHGGGIEVDSAPGAGSTFHLYLPRAELQQADEVPPADGGPAARGAGQRVLYVDDDEVMVLMVERLLARAGFEVETATEAVQALARVQAEPARYDLVVTDFNMPEMSGIELTRRLRALNAALPVVITSGFLSEEQRVQALLAGARALLRKENAFEELAGVVQAVLAADAPAD